MRFLLSRSHAAGAPSRAWGAGDGAHSLGAKRTNNGIVEIGVNSVEK